MKQVSTLAGSLAACLLVATVVQALTVGYGHRDIAEGGVGCVGGWISAHGNTAYFRGDTELLNTHLASLAAETADHSHARIVLHTGTGLIDNPEERPLTGFGDQKPNQLAIDWSVRRYCPPNDVLAGRCKCDHRNVTVDIWIANDIRLDALLIPSGFPIESGREIEHFIVEHAKRKQSQKSDNR